jgi:aldehyde:ferredoxin oxidoreductase
MHGWTGKILRVDLGSGKVSKEDLDPTAARDFMGGRGLGIKYLFDEINPAVDALSHKNKLIMATGPLTGTAAPSANRYMVVTKSPLTGAIANSSSGGFFAAELKYAGYDLIIFEGKAKKPVYLWIENDNVEIRSAEGIWGMNTYETQDAIRAATDEFARVTCIGPAGENLVKLACIINDNGRAAGRSGVGAVMGSKNLKAVAVRGTKGVTVADADGFKNAVKALLASHEPMKQTWYEPFGKLGTLGIAILLVNEAGVLPTRNFQTGVFENAERLSGELLNETYSKRRNRIGEACFACPVACGRVSKVTGSEFAGEGHGPEYETTGAFGASCGIDNLAAVAKANFLCNELGLDTISTGMTISCAMELYEKGFLPEKDVGAKLNFGNAEAMVNLVAQTAYREGFGDLIAEGSYRMAEKYGHPELSMSAKKQEFPCYEPRGLQGLALQYATQSRGGDHIRAEVHDVTLWGVTEYKMLRDRNITKPLNPFVYQDKPWVVKEIQDLYGVVDCSGTCCFVILMGASPEESLQALFETATGISLGDYKGMMQVGERTFNLERLFNLKAGLTKADDTLPPRMLKEPMPEGPAKGQVVHLKEMLPEYYRLRGWDEEGIPTSKKLEELGLPQLNKAVHGKMRIQDRKL